MKKFYQIVLATVALSFLLVGQSFASASEERIFAQSSASDQGWEMLMKELAVMPMKVGDQDVNGYDPETGLVFTAALLQRVCYNQTPAHQQACAEFGERYKLFASRNGWTEAFIHQTDLRKQAQKGMFFPFGKTVATPVATVTPEQLQALEATFAKAQTALMAKVTANAQAVALLREELAAKERAEATLREQLARAPEEARTAIKVEIAAAADAAKTARNALKKSVDDQIDQAITAAGTAAAKAVAPAASQAAAALVATTTFGSRLTEAEASTNRAFKAVGDRVSTVETGVKEINTSLIQRFGSIAIAFIGAALILLAYVGFRLSRGLGKVSTDAVKAAEAKATAEVQKQMDEVVTPLQSTVNRIDHEAEQIKAVLGDKYKVFSFDKKELTAEIERLKVGGVLTVDFTVGGDSRQHQVLVARKTSTQVVLRGITKQQETVGVNTENAVGRIMRAYNKVELVTQQTTASVVPIVSQIPTVFEERAA